MTRQSNEANMNAYISLLVLSLSHSCMVFQSSSCLLSIFSDSLISFLKHILIHSLRYQHPAFNIQHPLISHLWITMICYFAKNIHFPIRLKIFSIEHFTTCTNLYPSWHIEASTRNMLFVLTMLFGAKPDSRVDDKMDLARESLSFLDESEFGIPSRLANQLGQSFREQLT